MEFLGEEIRNSDGKLLPFSTAVISGGLVFVSGQVPLRDGVLVGSGFSEQANVVFDNLEAVLATAGLRLSSIVKVTAWITSADFFAEFNAVYVQRVGDHRPARSTVVSALALPGAMIEVEAVAELG